MIENIKKWCNYCNLPLEAQTALIDGYEKLIFTPENKAIFDEIIQTYANDLKCDFALLREKMVYLAESANVHTYTAYAIMYVCMNPALKNHYINAGYPLDIYYETIKDVSFHMRSTKLCDGVWGTYTGWHSALYRMEIFGFGRLQAQPIKSTIDYQGNGFNLVKGETYYINLHIPRTETPLDFEESQKSLDKMAKFFKDIYFKDSKILFHCQSWLLFEKHPKMLKPTSNILKFYNRFTIIDKGFYPNYNEIWRLFDAYYSGNADDFNANSSLRKEYVKLVKYGRYTGWGRGVFYYE